MGELTGTGSAYIRISSDKQETERQYASIQAWAEKRGVSITQHYEDTGSRDKSENRRAIKQLLRHVAEGHIPWVVVADVDRLGVKDQYELFRFIYDFRQHGCQLWSAADDVCISASDEMTAVKNLFAGITSEKE